MWTHALPDHDGAPTCAGPLGAVGRARECVHAFLLSLRAAESHSCVFQPFNTNTDTRQIRPQPPCSNLDQLHEDTEVARKLTGRPAAGASVVTTAGLPWPVTPRNKQGEQGAKGGSGAPAGEL